jgi:RNA polymerase sigma factor (sigma-70 family)
MAVQISPRIEARAKEPLADLHAHEEEGLAQQVGGGSERAFAALYRRYHRQLYRYCAAMLRHDADAQDALQSTFAAAFAALSHGRRDAPLRPWLFRIAHNEAVSIIRRRRPHDELSDRLATPEAFVPEQAEERDRLARLVADLRTLPER